MYIVGETITVKWVLQPTTLVIIRANINIAIVPPDLGDSSYLSSEPITVGNFLSPSQYEAGYAKYDYTPDVAGLHRLHLNEGTDTAYTAAEPFNLYVHLAETVVKHNVDTIALDLGV